ncbi:MBL fold metallo-hydrolase [Flavihumibacter petaseus]|uniref:Putative hydrolase n=1 Tax=Flavihumibacter petaseus NBRC 106054 TaxID=1220578 RepID=A0A0E9MZ79_9BACT|nr:MBL fold metallo-hydrolase [Flavihumibacter petaseus]GAO43042.1 putative hydrolase [Flavihumibacter petaseus NBRC 106054]
MILEQIYTGCLAQGAYYIESDGEAVIIDPLRESAPYLQRARRNKARINYIFETHFHADFVSGHVELSAATGATIVFGPHAETTYPAHTGYDGELFRVGQVTFELIHTPGHTLESVCYLLRDEGGNPVALFTGDTLFIGDVGRPDLAQQPDNAITKESLAGMLYDSLRNRIMPLPDDIVVYPAHGAGSACGKNMSSETSATLGHQKANNYALRQDMTKEEFVREVTEGLLPPPAYFPMNVWLNRKGSDAVQQVVARGAKALTLEAFEAAMEIGQAIILDTRHAVQFAKGFIPGSINIGLDGSFAPWVGALIPFNKQPILVIADEGREEEVVTRLARIGYDNTIGTLKGGIDTWRIAAKPVDHLQTVTAAYFADTISPDHAVQVIDVRKESEYRRGHIRGAINIPLDNINEAHQLLDKQKTYFVHCAAGYRSMVFNSIMKGRGFHHLVDIQGGYNALQRLVASETE